jgi:hypothetical protein
MAKQIYEPFLNTISECPFLPLFYMDLVGLPEILVKHYFHLGCEIAGENHRVDLIIIQEAQ